MKRSQVTHSELLDYACEFKKEIDSFIKPRDGPPDGHGDFNSIRDRTYFNVRINQSEDFIECITEISKESKAVDKYSIKQVNFTINERLSNVELPGHIRRRVYSQCGLRLFDGSLMFNYKTSHSIKWTKIQVIEDVRSIIGRCLSAGMAAGF